MFDHSVIGRESPAIRNEVEKGAIRKFVEAIGEQNPLYYDEDYARNTPYGGIIAPPTFCRTFTYGEVPGLNLPKEGMVHGEQKYTYFRVLRPGDIVYCSSRLVDIQEKEGKSGKLTFIIQEQVGRDEHGELFFSARRAGVIREAVVQREQSRKEEAPSKVQATYVPTVAPRFSEVNIGDMIGPLELPPINRIQLAKYAGASGDFNPIHISDEIARETGLDGVIAHGMLNMSFLGRLLTDWVGLEGFLVSWEVRFKAMVSLWDVLTCRGKVLAKEADKTADNAGGIVHCEVWIENQKGNKVIEGKASVRLP
ncbi:MAG: MaoC family dehydratase N-terminal domain-containing protein [Desulfitobacteriaceae bacterium]|nr:MaoC family dehydratase N-terminal domain-containing protein [Desulfitobacteriaceae bacterium]MDI6913594.1 MaoC family dehydratase N-terminal domain-containing protein [Desulfitobacteriaceae bacterium]